MKYPLPANGTFKKSEMHISNTAYREFLLNDENAAFNEDGTFNEVAEIVATLALMYEEGGQERVNSFFIQFEKETGRKIGRSS